MFTCGLFLIMMGSKTGYGAEATAANYHLEKGIYQKNRGRCQTCGHTNCDPEKGCDANLGDSRWLQVIYRQNWVQFLYKKMHWIVVLQ